MVIPIHPNQSDMQKSPNTLRVQQIEYHKMFNNKHHKADQEYYRDESVY